jgi:hypothetical protein
MQCAERAVLLDQRDTQPRAKIFAHRLSQQILPGIRRHHCQAGKRLALEAASLDVLRAVEHLGRQSMDGSHPQATGAFI